MKRKRKKNGAKSQTASPQRPSNVEIALKLRGTGGRCFTSDGVAWRDTQTGACGTLADLAEAWTAEPEPVL